jgi:pimeloyl-ACP methyl ester carboxylesterase
MNFQGLRDSGFDLSTSSGRHIPRREINAAQRIMASPIGEILARRWLDWLILQGLKRLFFPFSRLWAAARAANGEVDEFAAAAPLTREIRYKAKLRRALRIFERERANINSVELFWQENFFGSGDVPEKHLISLEEARLHARSRYNVTRRHFTYLRHWLATTVFPSFVTPQEFEAVYGVSGEKFEQLFAPPVMMPKVERSRSIATASGRDSWIRFASPAAHMGDDVYARVHEPVGIENPPTLIFGHGICVEFDHWRNLVDPIANLPRWGIRVIRPEGPWHGRRVPEGYYGGEPFLSRAPKGEFDYFTAQHREWAVLMDWSRRTSTGPVAFGGSSLGAQSAQMTSIRARNWPKHLQPDALFLMTHCEHVGDVATDSDLSDIWGLHEPLGALGWRRDMQKEWLAKLDPSGAPVVPPSRIVSVLGRHDRVTHFSSGQKLQEKWRLPPENRFVWPCGHFTVPLRLGHDTRPLDRLQEIFDEIAVRETR